MRQSTTTVDFGDFSRIDWAAEFLDGRIPMHQILQYHIDVYDAYTLNKIYSGITLASFFHHEGNSTYLFDLMKGIHHWGFYLNRRHKQTHYIMWENVSPPQALS